MTYPRKTWHTQAEYVILIAPPHTYVAYATQATISSVKQSKTNVTQHRVYTGRERRAKIL